MNSFAIMAVEKRIREAAEDPQDVVNYMVDRILEGEEIGFQYAGKRSTADLTDVLMDALCGGEETKALLVSVVALLSSPSEENAKALAKVIRDITDKYCDDSDRINEFLEDCRQSQIYDIEMEDAPL